MARSNRSYQQNPYVLSHPVTDQFEITITNINNGIIYTYISNLISNSIYIYILLYIIVNYYFKIVCFLNIAPFPRCSCAYDSPCIRSSVRCNEKNDECTDLMQTHTLEVQYAKPVQCNVDSSCPCCSTHFENGPVQLKHTPLFLVAMEAVTACLKPKVENFILCNYDWTVPCGRYSFGCFFSTENSENRVHRLKLPCQEALSGSPIQNYLNI